MHPFDLDQTQKQEMQLEIGHKKIKKLLFLAAYTVQ